MLIILCIVTYKLVLAALLFSQYTSSNQIKDSNQTMQIILCIVTYKLVLAALLASQCASSNQKKDSYETKTKVMPHKYKLIFLEEDCINRHAYILFTCMPDTCIHTSMHTSMHTSTHTLHVVQAAVPYRESNGALSEQF